MQHHDLEWMTRLGTSKHVSASEMVGLESIGQKKKFLGQSSNMLLPLQVSQ
jgi:hypothetical protein